MVVEWKKGSINECGSMQDDGGWGGVVALMQSLISFDLILAIVVSTMESIIFPSRIPRCLEFLWLPSMEFGPGHAVGQGCFYRLPWFCKFLCKACMDFLVHCIEPTIFS
jgi:hypothetical protein